MTHGSETPHIAPLVVAPLKPDPKSGDLCGAPDLQWHHKITLPSKHQLQKHLNARSFFYPGSGYWDLTLVSNGSKSRIIPSARWPTHHSPSWQNGLEGVSTKKLQLAPLNSVFYIWLVSSRTSRYWSNNQHPRSFCFLDSWSGNYPPMISC